jgi:hypothetical protein
LGKQIANLKKDEIKQVFDPKEFDSFIKYVVALETGKIIEPKCVPFFFNPNDYWQK